MVPRDQKEKARLGSVRNFIEPGDRSPIQLRPSPIDDSVNDDNYVDVTTVDNEDDLDIPVTEDGGHPQLVALTDGLLAVSVILLPTEGTLSNN